MALNADPTEAAVGVELEPGANWDEADNIGCRHASRLLSWSSCWRKVWHGALTSVGMSGSAADAELAGAEDEDEEDPDDVPNQALLICHVFIDIDTPHFS